MKTAEEKKYILTDKGETFTPRGVVVRDASVRFVLALADGAVATKIVLRIHSDRDGSMHLFDMEKRSDGSFDASVRISVLCGDLADGLFYYCYDVYYPDGCVTFGGESPTRLYPCGEGAGYAGGIVSSALDGINCAAKI